MATVAPSMDICVSSNFERFLFHLSGDDGEVLRKWLSDFEATGARTFFSIFLHFPLLSFAYRPWVLVGRVGWRFIYIVGGVDLNEMVGSSICQTVEHLTRTMHLPLRLMSSVWFLLSSGWTVD